MRKSLITLIILSCGMSSFAQKKTTILITPRLGYETNLLKSPSSMVQEEGSEINRNELWKNAPFVGTSVSLIRKASEKYSWRVNGSYKSSLLSESTGVKASDAQLKFRHSYSGKKTKNTFDLGARLLVRTGASDFDDLLGAPLSYKRANFSNTTDIQLSKKWHLIPQLFGEFKWYDRDSYDRFMYGDLGIRTRVNYRYTYMKKIGVSMLGEFHQRNYRMTQFTEEIEVENEEENESEEIEETEESEEGDENESYIGTSRVWNYYKGGIALRFPGKLGVVTTGIYYTHRNDASEGRYGYNQLGWTLNWTIKRKKSKLIIGNTLLYRTYSNYTALVDNEQTALSYLFLKPEITWKRQLGKRVNFFLTANCKFRGSSVDQPTSQGLRSYFISSVFAGVVIKLSSTQKPKRH